MKKKVEIVRVEAKKPAPAKKLVTALDAMKSAESNNGVAQTAAAPAVSSKEKVVKPAKAATAPVAAPKQWKPRENSVIHKALLEAGFTYVSTPEPVSGALVHHGYNHKDGRAAVHGHEQSEVITQEFWIVAYPGRDSERGTDVEEFRNLLKREAKEAEHKAAQLVPAHVIRAVEMLGGYSKQRYELSMLDGKKMLGARIKLLSRLLRKDVAQKDATHAALVTTFFSAVGTGEGTAKEKLAEFIRRCKAIALAERKSKMAAKKAEKETIQKALRATVLERTVPGTILPAAEKKSKKQRAAEQAQAAKDVIALAVTAEPLAAPRPDAVIETIVAADVRLLEDGSNGLVMLQVERANSQGAICVYNNGVRVAAGVVPTEKLKTLRTTKDVDVLEAARQLLNPVVPNVPVTSTATRHLTAVLHCKELIAMNTAKAKKFAAPATTKSTKPAKAEKAADKTDSTKAKKAAKGEKAARAPRISDDAKIKIITKANPYKEGTKSFVTYALLLKANTVGEFRALLEKSKNEVYEAAHFLNYASKEQGKMPAHVAVA